MLSVAIKDGKLGVMDYYGMRNLISDTEMRSSIAGTGANQQRPNIT